MISQGGPASYCKCSSEIFNVGGATDIWKLKSDLADVVPTELGEHTNIQKCTTCLDKLQNDDVVDLSTSSS